MKVGVVKIEERFGGRKVKEESFGEMVDKVKELM